MKEIRSSSHDDDAVCRCRWVERKMKEKMEQDEETM